MQDDEGAIRELVDTWMRATREGDTDTVLDLMTDDVVFLVPGAEPFGKAAFRDMARSMSEVRMEGRSDILEMRVLGDWAFIRNYIHLEVTPPGSPTTRRAGQTLTILRRCQDGRWRLARDANLVTIVED